MDAVTSTYILLNEQILKFWDDNTIPLFFVIFFFFLDDDGVLRQLVSRSDCDRRYSGCCGGAHLRDHKRGRSRWRTRCVRRVLCCQDEGLLCWSTGRLFRAHTWYVVLLRRLLQPHAVRRLLSRLLVVLQRYRNAQTTSRNQT